MGEREADPFTKHDVDGAIVGLPVLLRQALMLRTASGVSEDGEPEHHTHTIPGVTSMDPV